MANPYKEYKAYIPQKWRSFDDSAPALLHTKSKFVHCLGNNVVHDSPLLTAEVEPIFDPSAASSRLRGSEKWAAEMKVYCAEVKQKKEGMDRTQRLQKDLRKKQQVRMRHREADLSAPTVNGREMPANFHSLQIEHPAAVEKYQALLAAAGDIDQKLVQVRCNEYVQKEAERVEADVSKHLDLVEKRRAKAARKLLERTREAADREHELGLRASMSRLERSDAIEHQRQEIAQQISAQTETSKQLSQLRNSPTPEKPKMLVRRSPDKMWESTMRSPSPKKMQTYFQREVEDLAEQALRERERHRKIVHDHGQQALDRAIASRQQRAAELREAGEKCAEKRQQQLKKLQASRRENLMEMKRRNRDRVNVADDNLHEMWSQRVAKIEHTIEVHHSPVRQREEVAVSPTIKRVHHALMLKRKVDAEKFASEERRRAKQLDASTRVEHQRCFSQADASKRHAREDEHRLEVLSRAFELERSTAQKTEDDAAARQRKADDALTILRRREREERRERMVQESSRIVRCTDHVNVEQRLQLIDELNTAQKRLEEREAERAAILKNRNELARQEREQTAKRMREQVAQAAAKREAELKQFMKRHDQRVTSALSVRDETLYRQSLELRRGSEERRNKSLAAAEAKEQQFLKRAKNVKEKDARVSRHLAREHRERALQSRERMMNRALMKEELDARKDEIDAQRNEQTLSKLEDTYSKGRTLHEATSVCNFTRPVPLYLSPIRARSTSPLYSTR